MEIGFTSVKKYLLLYTSVQYHEEIRCWEIMNIIIISYKVSSSQQYLYFVIVFLWSLCRKYFCSRFANRTSIE